MSNYKITLKPVYSRPASTLPTGVTLPSDWSSLAWHQAKTYEALQDPSIDVIFNTALTGDGKSLAAYLAAMTQRTYTLATYPTNELGRDQEKQAQGYKAKFKPQHDPQIYRLNAAVLEEFIATNKIPSKLEGLINRADNSEILLTNPDIFHYIHDFRYLRRNKAGKGDNSDRLFQKIDNNYNLFIFDEFHVFSSPQITNILNAILLIKHTTPGKKFLFLSATPNELLQEFLSNIGLRYNIIDPVSQEAYKFTNEEGWRQINFPVDLIFPRNLEPSLSSNYNWIVENAETIILRFFQENTESKGAIILNSIAAVKKLLPKFQELFAPLGLKVRENTGLTGETEKSKSVEEADLLLGTSTIDVGVDFKINFLVFEAADAGNFIQRFGRLGRHGGFDTYQAYALLPNFIVERLFEVDKHPLQNGDICDRITFSNIIRAHYGYINEFKQYPKRWGGIQSACVHLELNKGNMKAQYPEAANRFEVDIQKALGISLKQKYAQLFHCMKESKKKIIEEVRSFRGSSQLDCGIYDATNPDEPEQERYKIYNLPSILSNFIYQWVDKESFTNEAKKAGLSINRFERALCYLKLTGYREVREDWKFYCSREDLSEIAKSGKVQVLKGLEATAGINQISGALWRRDLVCFVSDRNRSTLRAKLGLPIHFQAYSLSDCMEDRNPPYTIAFGQSALLLETLIWHWKPQEDEGWIC
ncbi:type I-D CRISPR-associated helicase Cas3' [Desertifilum sp. FACHB-1129]|uniref:Type I-D CRISPR-associated helicase Cas3 n=1 Tax=Desertifilum tharense IPPAS B-1220 TaxID=1781255 RepID=A0A1E5QGU6_9CYAN|nr:MULTISPECIES: type I-D CRISPR-associated helicase Cas3' [Desertifilum]MDA0209608.1 type I-D CRISPR-associated helicase Cas3' [Cyanobacteria bacterium FC1]MBD2313018.1 type I-D CRISPR-associated helicase Cas3' [Desertifilum sp. FACHB-1129]MBD2320936.1 type I-D CRISPR-associated helicase Cas3' [Desertifilum sp. FACHB-866]MBD2331065.1 type I-D CRISPR-associated helicase Cas3' [Desertifilum sp. FACHB-868]OEJ73879.1 type I-D CRISPR-associated helicase Cas3' [Desertifilum tharense IPPAS B-1220]